MRPAEPAMLSWGQALALTAALSIVAWRSYVFIRGGELSSYYNFGGDAAKQLVVSFSEPVVLFVVIPLITVGAGSLVITAIAGRPNLLRSYLHGLIAAGLWLTVGLYGLWYAHR
jgi:hypothetical protein